jgi:hypothetical protein
MVSRSLTRSSQSVFVEDSICDRLTFALRVVETGLLIAATEKKPDPEQVRRVRDHAAKGRG